MREINTADYRNAPSGIGPRAAEWKDKPHRLVYDLCTEVERLREAISAMHDDAVNADEYREIQQKENAERRDAGCEQ